MRILRLAAHLAVIGLLGSAACHKTAPPTPDAHASERADGDRSSGSTSAPPAAADTGPIDPHAMADEIRAVTFPVGVPGFDFPDPPVCGDAGPNDPWVVRCAVTARDTERHAPALIDIELYDHDLVFEDRKAGLYAMTQAMSTNGINEEAKNFTFTSPDGAVSSIKTICYQPTGPLGSAFYLVLPTPRVLIVTIVKPTIGTDGAHSDCAAAGFLGQIVLASLPARALPK